MTLTSAPKEKHWLVMGAFILAMLLTVFGYLSKFYLSQNIDDMHAITLMNEFPQLVRDRFYTDAWFYPFKIPVWDVFELLILPSILGNILHPLLGDWFLTQQAVAITFVYVTALSMYYVSYRLYGDKFGSLFAAVAYGYSNTFIMRMPSHINLLGGFVFPLLLYTLKSSRYCLAGLMMGLAYWSSPQYGLMALIFALTYFVYEFFEKKFTIKNLILHYSVAALIFLAMTAFIIPSSMKIQTAFITNDPTNLFWRGQYAFILPGGELVGWEKATPYLGLTMLIVAVIVLLKKRNRFNCYLLLVSLLFIMLSMIPIPLWPFQAIRAPDRFSVIALFALSLVASQFFTLRAIQSLRFKKVLILILLFVLVADNAVAPPQWFFINGWGYEKYNPGFEVIKMDPETVAEIHFPIMPSDSGTIYYQYYRVLTGKKIVDGQTSGLASIRPLDDMFWNIRFLKNFLIWNTTDKWLLSYRPDAFKDAPDSYDLWLLKGWSIKYIVLHKRLYSDIVGTDSALQYLGRLEGKEWILKVYEDSSIAIYKITIS